MKFRADDFDLKDDPQSWKLTGDDDDIIKAAVESTLRYMTRETPETLNIHFSSVCIHLMKLRYTGRLDIWLPPKQRCSFDDTYKHL